VIRTFYETNNYRIHTDAIQEHLIPAELTKSKINCVYASEADLLNMALFGMTAKEWRDNNPELQGNMPQLNSWWYSRILRVSTQCWYIKA